MSHSHQTFHPIIAVKLLWIMFRNTCWPTTFHTITVRDADGGCHKQPVWLTPHVPITPNFPSDSSHETVVDYVEKHTLAHHFSHYYSRRCWRMIFELVSVVRPAPSFISSTPSIATWGLMILINAQAWIIQCPSNAIWPFKIHLSQKTTLQNATLNWKRRLHLKSSI